ncbi:NADPH-dependent 2,4-dienoyl-CoA reductase/sulfur reductase-like enzyme [Methylopila capsulata]|uniref:(2Fe-2S)-binding protein n=1 Tax=Methylopila capsulata TaxID=61654 RepID=A0A9W6MQK3_9HYPH|nr:NAD(P)/FAD-dependent oxidoreductase [Methylopila capsulata]MBM7851013.1 NADPH-dependent 2,4-dienoyl-CoA reductase/sulfur reductase-like enzyme [Methylopila capsulata]GLK54071.1 (2Fe-2S)-binding protein [Methylopila capsulata]
MIELGQVAHLDASYDLVVIGAGPAGLACAAQASAGGARTLLVDENAAPGGQIYRSVGATPLRARRDILGADYWTGEELASSFAASGAAYLAGATVWQVSPEREIGLSKDGSARLIDARHVVMATGALERPFPIPGWTQPGVMTAGAAQILLKTAGATATGRVVLAGSGPLLWLIAAQSLAAGRSFSAILDTTPKANWTAALAHLPSFLASPYLAKGLKLLRRVRREIAVVSGVTALEAEGDGRLERVRYVAGGETRTIGADHLFLHQGVTPNVNMASAAGCELVWDDLQLCWRPKADAWGRTSVPGIAVAGDGAGIAGAEAAALRGSLAALDALDALGLLPGDEKTRRAAPLRKTLARYDRGRGFLDALYRPAKSFRTADGDTIACRCEEVTGGQIRAAVADLHVAGPNQLKSFLRCGMGPCQGRLCGLTVSETIADARGVSPADVGYYRLRSPVKPITLAEIATLDQTEADVKAVARG